jgi:hypothetical protein
MAVYGPNNEQSRDTGNTGHTLVEENKTQKHNTTQKTKKFEQHGSHQKTHQFVWAQPPFCETVK